MIQASIKISISIIITFVFFNYIYLHTYTCIYLLILIGKSLFEYRKVGTIVLLSTAERLSNLAKTAEWVEFIHERWFIPLLCWAETTASCGWLYLKKKRKKGRKKKKKGRKEKKTKREPTSTGNFSLCDKNRFKTKLLEV